MRLGVNLTSRLGWKLYPLLLWALFLLPLTYIVVYLFVPLGADWEHLKTYLLGDYVFNSLMLGLLTLFFAAIMGFGSAYCIAFYDFPGRKLLSWVLLLPLTFPTYLMAYAFHGFCSGGILHEVWPSIALPDLRNLIGLSFILALVLYPYIYMACRINFNQQAANPILAAQTLGASWKTVFWKIVLPLSRPALIGGGFLVVAETFNDFGAVSYFNVPTLTTGIFKSWTAYNNLPLSLRLAAFSMLLILSLLLLERWSRRHKRYQTRESAPVVKKTIKGWKALWLLVICAFPVVLGYAVPLSQLVFWAFHLKADVLNSLDLTSPLWNTFLMGSVVALICVLLSVLLLFTENLVSKRWMAAGNQLLNAGYALPGAVLAIGILAFFILLGKTFSFSLMQAGLLLLGLGLVVRYLSIALSPLKASFEKLSPNLIPAGLSLQKKPAYVFRHVIFSALRKQLPLIALLVFIDVVKELPLTLILRPFNFETITTITYQFAEDEMVEYASFYAIFMLVMGLVPLYFLQRKLLK